MSLNNFSDGINTSFSTELNNNFKNGLIINGLNTIRQLIDRSGIYSADTNDGWGEAYVDTNGRDNSIDSSAQCGWSVVNNDVFPIPETVANSTATGEDAEAFDGDIVTTGSTNSSSRPATLSLETTFDSQLIGDIVVSWNYSQGNVSGSGGGSISLYIQTYNGSSWNNIDTTVIGNVSENQLTMSHSETITVNDTIQGIKITTNSIDNDAAKTLKVYCGGVSTTSTETIIHDIPSGTFNDTISSSFATALVEDWETGANIQYKLTNATEDTGWLDYNEISNFTAFTSEPTKLTVKLIPKSSSPTAGYPSIKGSWIIAR